MQHLFLQSLIAFQQPIWLLCLPLATLPVWLLRLWPLKFRPVPAGWGLDIDDFISGKISLRKWRAILAAMSLLCLILALARPDKPKIALLEMIPRGHHHAIIIDCSGSMAQIDPGQSQSRLQRLTTALRQEMQSRPFDRFTIIRVAGYVNRIGPPAASPAFLDNLLEQMQPASPGEDGSSLADGLVLAVDELTQYDPGMAKSASILLVSDGRDNPPDPASQRLDEIQSLIIQNAIPLNWLRLNLPNSAEESPESRKRAESAIKIIESITHGTHGTIINIDQQNNWPEFAARGISAALSDNENQMSSATILLILLAALCATAAGILAVFMVRIDFKLRRFRNAHLPIFHFGSLAIMIFVLIQLMQINQTNKMQYQPVQSAGKAIGIVLDISPSMAAKDTAHGSRLETAKTIAQAMIRQASLRNHEIFSVHAFSGLALQLTPWSSDASAADLTIQDLQWRQIKPDGSNWRDLLDHILKSTANIIQFNQRLENNIEFFIITDGEASMMPDESQIAQLRQNSIQLHFVTLGSDASPGPTFQADLQGNGLWLDRRTGHPAQSRRFDENPKQLAEQTGGQLISVGTSQIDPFQLAQNLIGIPNLTETKKTHENIVPLNLLIIAIIISITGEFSPFFHFLNAKNLIILLSLSLFTSCGGSDKNLTAKDKIRLAGECRDSGQYFQAETLLRSVDSGSHNHQELHYDIGLVLLDQNRAEDALTEFRKCLNAIESSEIQTDLLKSRATYAQGYALAMLGRWKESLAELQNALEQPYYQTPKNQVERNEIEKNINYIQIRISNQDKPVSKAPDDEFGELKNDVNRFSQMLMRAEIRERAGQVKSRARSVRNIFDRAGDQISGPLPKLNETGLMDW